MSVSNVFRICFILVLMVLAGCGPSANSAASTSASTQAPAVQTDTVAAAPTVMVARPTQTPEASTLPVAACAYIPGQSAPAQIPPEAPTPTETAEIPTPSIFNPTKVDSATTNKEQAIFKALSDEITSGYVTADFNGRDWKAINKKYADLIAKGLTTADFYIAMKAMLAELDGGISSFLTPDEVKQNASSSGTGSGFVGIGGLFNIFNLNNQEEVVLTGVYSGSPAEKAGLQAHDILLKVDGGPFFDSNHNPRTPGKEGTSVTVTVQTPGQQPRDVTMTRELITSTPRVEYCMFYGTKIGYIRWLNSDDSSLYSQVGDALTKLGAAGSLQGLVLDPRYSIGNGDTNSLQDVMSYFADGEVGAEVSPSQTYPIDISPSHNISGSQSIPLVILQSGSSSFSDQLFDGLLQANGRARIVGVAGRDMYFNFKVVDLTDGSQLVMAALQLQPKGKPVGYFNQNFVAPDVVMPVRWDLFTAANDPQIAKAVDLLMNKN